MSAPSKAPQTAPTVTEHPSFWQCSDTESSLTVDLRGNASYKRRREWLPEAPPGGRASSRRPNLPLDEGSFIQKARQLASPWVSGEQLRSLKPAIKRETLLLAKLPAGTITELPGRTIIRLLGPDDIGGGAFQAVFDSNGWLLRMDIAFANARTKDLCTRSLLKAKSAAKNAASQESLTLGCFFDPSEYRFEISAFAVEGEPFIKLEQESNPYPRDEFDLKAPDRVSVERYRDSQDYHWWCWAWWHHYGCVGSFRGNALETDGQTGWEYPKRRLIHHRSLSSYPTTQGPPRQAKVFQQSDGPRAFPFAVSQTFGPTFYKDLEECNVAFIFTHGGPIEGVYQVRRGLDVWALLAPPLRKLGVGKLRHLFLDGCAAMTFRREPQSAHLVRTWIRWAPANGLRTVCGVDGVSSGLDRSGWRFFGYYNKGESVSDSWAFASLDEDFENCPATAAYGKTTGEALESLLRARFIEESAQSKAVAVSVWSGSSTP
jgi:hypothetical protein